jgi:Peptidase A4 family
MYTVKYKYLRWLSAFMTLCALVAFVLSVNAISKVNASPVTAKTTNSMSNNWSGYSVSGYVFNGVSAEFNVPRVSCSVPGSMMLAWVGLDGVNGDKTVEQTGMWVYCGGGAIPVPTYIAFWQMYPSTQANAMPLEIHEGDRLYAAVKYSVQSGMFSLTVKDETSNKQFTKLESCQGNSDCQRNSAEWIVERPSNSNNSVQELARWDRLNFSSAMSSIGSVSKPLYDLEPSEVNMVSNRSSRRLIDLSYINRNNASFSASWKAYQ